jgi:dTDP-4-amino-4,6-dideoxygalactose transaminase
MAMVLVAVALAMQCGAMTNLGNQMNRTLTDLAIFGGKPAFAERLHVGRPNIGNRENLLARINDILERRWLTNLGPYVQELERRIAETVGVKHCIAICNGTIALEIAIRALDLTGEVIIPAMTFIATAHALQWQGIIPVFCDIDPKSHNLDPERVEELITPHTTGILGVHLWGRACPVESLTAIAHKHKLKLLFDAAHAFGCSYKGQMIGNFGDAEVYSFHATKFFNTFEGGAIVTNIDELATKIRLMKNFGFQALDKVVHIGTNGKMNEVSAAMGLTSLESMESFMAINLRNYKQYQCALANIPGIALVSYDEHERNNYQYVILDVDETVAGVSRDQLVGILRAENVMTRRYFYPGCHRMEPYRTQYPTASTRLPETERLVHRLLCLPTGTAIGEGEIAQISQIIRLVVQHGVEVRTRLQGLISAFDNTQIPTLNPASLYENPYHPAPLV